MPVINDLLGGIARLTKSLNLLEERFDRQQEENREVRKEISELRKEVASLASRVAVLEEARKTTAAEVKAALTETIATWELERARREARDARDEADRLRRASLPPAQD